MDHCIYMASSPLPKCPYRTKSSRAHQWIIKPGLFSKPWHSGFGYTCWCWGGGFARSCCQRKGSPPVSTGAVYRYSTVIGMPAEAAVRDMDSLVVETAED